MTGQGKKTQSTSQRSTKNRSSQRGAGQNNTSSKNRNSSTSSELISELLLKVDALTQENIQLRSENQLLRSEVLQKSSKSSDNESQSESEAEPEAESEAESDDNRPAKRRKKTTSDDEEQAKNLMRKLIKGYSSELNLKDEETFKSDINVKICEKLIPKLQKEIKDIKPMCNLTYKQVETWLQSVHKTRRRNHKKSNQPVDDLSSNSRLQVDGGDTKSTKRQKKSKGKKSSNVSEDEESVKIDEDAKIEEGAKILMKTLIKEYPSDLNLRDEETFKSYVNVKICEKLIPTLQKDIKPTYNLSHKQVETWLQTFHKNKRKNFMKGDYMVVDYNYI